MILGIFHSVMEYQDVADAAVDIGGINQNNNWISLGSGFHFVDAYHIVTNYHVVRPIKQGGGQIHIRTESNDKIPADVINYSDLEENGGKDWALLKMKRSAPKGRTILSPGDSDMNRGKDVCFAGFPHGVGHGDLPDLLVQSAKIAGEYGDYGFYLDGSVNKGNSGGPIVDLESESVVGYVTFKRYVEQDTIDQVMTAWENLHNNVNDADEVFETSGLGYFDVLTEMTRTFLLLRETIETNANTGIGMGFNIGCVDMDNI